MKTVILTAVITSVIYLILKVIEIKFIEKTEVNIKLIIKDTLLVFFSVISGHFIFTQIKPLMNGIVSEETSATTPKVQVFTDHPSF